MNLMKKVAFISFVLFFKFLNAQNRSLETPSISVRTDSPTESYWSWAAGPNGEMNLEYTEIGQFLFLTDTKWRISEDAIVSTMDLKLSTNNSAGGLFITTSNLDDLEWFINRSPDDANNLGVNDSDLKFWTLRKFTGGTARSVVRRFDTNGNAYKVSDKSLKTELETTGGYLEKLELLRPRYYKFKNDDFSRSYHGFFAQDIRSVFPELVKTMSEDHIGIDYEGLIPITIGALKEHVEYTHKLEERIVSLEKLIQAQERNN